MKMLLTTALAALLAPAALASEPTTGVAWCHDRDRNIVQRKLVHECEGRVVTEGEAVSIRREADRVRRARMARRVQAEDAEARSGYRFKSAGTGFSINESGEVLTGAHVVQGCDWLDVRGPGVASASGTVRASDPGLDLAIVKIDHHTRAYPRFAREVPTEAEPLALVGFPLAGMIRVEPKLTPVNVRGALAEGAGDALIGVEGDVRRGNSGGPALDSRGRIVGVVRAKVDSVAAYQQRGEALSGVGALIPAARVMGFLERSRTSYRIDGTAGVEQSGRQLFEGASRYLYRIDCLMRK